MNNDFGPKLKELREKKFPGRSLRRVGEVFTSSGEFGDYFYTQLSKMEAGLLSPSPNVLLKIMDVYSANAEERKEILVAYSSSVAWKKMGDVDQATNRSFRNEVVHQLYRRVKKRK